MQMPFWILVIIVVRGNLEGDFDLQRKVLDYDRSISSI